MALLNYKNWKQVFEQGIPAGFNLAAFKEKTNPSKAKETSSKEKETDSEKLADVKSGQTVIGKIEDIKQFKKESDKKENVFSKIKNGSESISPGDSGEKVKLIQAKLKEKGFFKEEPTGKYGNVTQEAVKDFQKKNGLTVDGIVGQMTYSKLFGVPVISTHGYDYEKQIKPFYEKYSTLAKEAEAITKVPRLITLAQAGLESGFGKSFPKFNYFGHKWDPTWKGERQLLRTSEVLKTNDRSKHKFPNVLSIEKTPDGYYKWIVKDWFRAYPDTKTAFIEHGKFLKSKKRYANAFLTNTPEEFAKEIAKGGYATDPGYATKLINIMQNFKRVESENTSKT
jgi:flagellum-specific peptidoglycan hydrolase FlgJ